MFSRTVCLPRVIPAASLKHAGRGLARGEPRESSAGHTRGLIEASLSPSPLLPRNASSAGHTRGLIEAASDRAFSKPRQESSAGHTRGLIEALSMASTLIVPVKSSAGHTRGLIEASGGSRGSGS